MKLFVQLKSLTDLLHQLQGLNEENQLTTASWTEERSSENPLPPLANVAPELVRLLSHPEIERLMRIEPGEDAQTDVMLPYILIESAGAAPN